jgi:hypothetical protein
MVLGRRDEEPMISRWLLAASFARHGLIVISLLALLTTTMRV